MGNIMEAMKKAQQFTSVAKDLQTELSNTEIETSVREGQVKVILTAQQRPVRVEVAPELVAAGHEEVRFPSLAPLQLLRGKPELAFCNFIHTRY